MAETNQNRARIATDDQPMSFSVMPHDIRSEMISDGETPVHPHPSSGAPTSPVPVPSYGAENSLPEDDDSHHSIWRNKWTYIITATLILIALGAMAYFLLWSDTGEETDQPAASKLPKIFLQGHFGTDTCTSPECADDSDPDVDGLQNYDEFVEQTDPKKSDSDGDGLADGDEAHVYLTNPIEKFTDNRPQAISNGYHDGSQIKNGYDPLTPNMKMTEVRLKQIQADTNRHGLHEPTKATLAATTPVAKTVRLFISNSKFDPASVTVSVGDTVVWVNQDQANHQIASDPHPAHTGLPDLESGLLATNQTYSYKFTAAGTFKYHDHLNPSIKGTVIVQ
jgi:plastocyanin